MFEFSNQQRGEIRLYGFVSSNGKTTEQIIETLSICSLDSFDNLNINEFTPLKEFVSSLIDKSLGGLLEEYDFWPSLSDFGSPLEEVFAVFSNVLQFDEKGNPINFDLASERAAQRVLVWHLGSKYSPVPEFSDKELFLHI